MRSLGNNLYTKTKLAFTKKCLFDALMLLMHEKSIDGITISELTEKAGVCRATFYRNYDSIIDIIVDYLNSRPLGFDMDMKNEDYTLNERINIYFLYLIENKILFDNLVKHNLTYHLLNTMEMVFRGPYLPIVNYMGFNDQYEVSAFIGIVYMVSIDWIKNGMVEDFNVITERSFNLLNVYKKESANQI